jgi:hypothetical protein
VDLFLILQTSLDPSHFPSLSLASSDDRTHGAATHPVRLDDPASSSSSELDEDSTLPSPTSSFFESKELPHRLSTFQLPDLRFEQGYLLSLMPFFHFDRSKNLEKQTHLDSNESRSPYVFGQEEGRMKAVPDLSSAEPDHYYLGSNFYVEWKMVVYVTLRDQVST